MNRLIRSLILFTGSLGLGAIAYALLKQDEHGFIGGLKPSSPGPRSPRAGSAGSPPPPTASEGASSITRCAGITRNGKRCSRESETGSTFCWQHGG